MFYFENPSFVSDELLKLKVKELILLLVNSYESGRVVNIIKDLFNPSKYAFKDVINSNLYQTKPAVMGSLIKGQFKKLIKDYFVSIEHYARTGESITLDNFKNIRKQYNAEAKKIVVT